MRFSYITSSSKVAIAIAFVVFAVNGCGSNSSYQSSTSSPKSNTLTSTTSIDSEDTIDNYDSGAEFDEAQVIDAPELSYDQKLARVSDFNDQFSALYNEFINGYLLDQCDLISAYIDKLEDSPSEKNEYILSDEKYTQNSKNILEWCDKVLNYDISQYSFAPEVVKYYNAVGRMAVAERQFLNSQPADGYLLDTVQLFTEKGKVIQDNIEITDSLDNLMDGIEQDTSEEAGTKIEQNDNPTEELPYDSSDPYYSNHDSDGDGEITAEEWKDSMGDAIDDALSNTHPCEVSGCTNSATHAITGISGQTEYYCDQHYNEMEDLLSSMYNDVYGD